MRFVRASQSVVRAVRFAPGRPDQLRSCGLDQRLLLHDRRLDAVVAAAEAGVPLTAMSCRHDGLMAVGTAGAASTRSGSSRLDVGRQAGRHCSAAPQRTSLGSAWPASDASMLQDRLLWTGTHCSGVSAAMKGRPVM